MDLTEHITQIQENIRRGRFINEAAVSQGIVMRLLSALNWPTYDTDIVAPEYTVESRRVDFALCHPTTHKAIVFIEVKRVGQGEGAEKQLFDYAFVIGVPLAILTDGQEWHIFLPGEQGYYQERRVYKLDLLDRAAADSAARIARYLDYNAVCSGKALEAARQDYHNVTREREIRTTLPIAFARLIEEQDEGLIELLAEKVESLCGYKPEPDTVTEFLASGVPTNVKSIVKPQPVTSPSVKPGKSKSQVEPTQDYGFTLLGQSFPAKNPTDVYFKVFEELARRDATFLPRFAALPQHGRKRRYLAQTPEELYPGQPELSDAAHQLTSGWWLGTNYSTSSKKKIIQLACQVAGLQFDTDLKVKL